MPEELNRIIADHLSTYLFAPTTVTKQNLDDEGIGRRAYQTFDGLAKQTILLTGNTTVDATLQNAAVAEQKSANLLVRLGLQPKKFVLVTAHRAENVDAPAFLQNLFAALDAFAKQTGLRIVYPVHPRTRNRLAEFGLENAASRFTLLPPQGYLEFLALEKAAALIVTDSGGVVEEACTLGVPSVTARSSADRPEAITCGASILGGVEKASLLDAMRQQHTRTKGWKNPYGDGKTSERIADFLKKQFA